METVYCSRCGENNLAGGSFCQKCGASLAPGVLVPMAPAIPVVVVSSPYGGFWIRVLAYIVDRIIVGIAFAPIAIFLALRLVGQLQRMPPNGPEQLGPIFHYVGVIVPLALVVQWLYEALLTSSPWQATVGKRILDLKVTDLAGNRISFERATGRFFAKILSSLLFGIGFLMVAFTARKQGLHDMMAETLVKKC